MIPIFMLINQFTPQIYDFSGSIVLSLSAENMN